MGTDFATGYFKCPHCGGHEFTAYPQTMVVNAKKQTVEYTCIKCRTVTAMVVWDWMRLDER